MNKISFVLIFLLSQIGCQNQQITLASSENIKLPIKTISENTTSNSSNKNIISETPNDDTTYPGKTIDEIFPFIAEHDFMEENFKGKTYSEKVDKFEITIKNFAPKMIIKDGKTIFNFKTLYPNEYHSNLIGVSHLLGKNSKQIYVVSGGPGGVCCTNYWITEVSGKTPRNIFRSEDFGSFRDAMEIFDADGDGIYELVQFDSAF